MRHIFQFMTRSSLVNRLAVSAATLEWADTQDQQVEHFWLNLLKWLSPPTECQVPIPPRVK